MISNERYGVALMASSARFIFWVMMVTFGIVSFSSLILGSSEMWRTFFSSPAPWWIGTIAYLVHTVYWLLPIHCLRCHAVYLRREEVLLYGAVRQCPECRSDPNESRYSSHG